MKNKRIVLALVTCFVAIVGMLLALYSTSKQKSFSVFVPPEFDSEAVVGIPTDAGKSWTPIYKDGMNFSAHVCGEVILNKSSADIYFTNDEGNEVWMKLRIMDLEGNILGETGLIKPGEYVKSVHFDTVPSVGTKIKMKIMTYEPETYYSAGAVSLNTMIG